MALVDRLSAVPAHVRGLYYYLLTFSSFLFFYDAVCSADTFGWRRGMVVEGLAP